MKKSLLSCLLALLAASVSARNTGHPPLGPGASWIWYPGDMSVWLSNIVECRRTERGAFYPPFWKLDAPYNLVVFLKDVTLPDDDDITIQTEGDCQLQLDGRLIRTFASVHLPAGHHVLQLRVFNHDKVPSIFVSGRYLQSDTSWRVTCEDKEWIDASGKVSDKSTTVWMPAESWGLHEPPSQYHLASTPVSPVTVTRNGTGRLLDFGKETFARPVLHGVNGPGYVNIYYGESREEALSVDSCETLDSVAAHSGPLASGRAFRYLNVQPGPGVRIDSVSALYEYLPLAERGAFRCSDTLINHIWDVAAYTLHLNTREFFLDGIKRDRWVWSGDAYQSYLMDYYLYFDSLEVTRTLYALRGKDPVTSHVNTILDYTFYWFMGIYDYYLYTGDASFIRSCYPRMVSLMDYVLHRRDADGMVQGLPGDWVFVDWADGLSKKGELSIEQLLFCRSLETMDVCARLAGDTTHAYGSLARQLRAAVLNDFWDPARGALIHNRVDGVLTSTVNRYANMFGILFDYFTPAQREQVLRRVLLNDSIAPITTPYMQFYQQAALCAMGRQPDVLNQIKSYWGGMLREGATTFWEYYDPAQHGVQDYAMYGRPYGRSLCHAWGASPLYLLGKYFLGVQPLSPGYATYVVCPSLGGLQWMSGSVPTPHGDVSVYCDRSTIRVTPVPGAGVLRFASRTTPHCAQAIVRATGNGIYEIELTPGTPIEVHYKAAEKNATFNAWAR